MLTSVDDPKYVGVVFSGCSTRKVELLIVLTSQNDFDALHHVTCIIFSRILLDHRFPTNMLLTSVDDVCPNQIYHHPAWNFCFIMKIIQLLVLIRCPARLPEFGEINFNKPPCAEIPNRMQNFTWSWLGAVFESFQFSTLNRPN